MLPMANYARRIRERRQGISLTAPDKHSLNSCCISINEVKITEFILFPGISVASSRVLPAKRKLKVKPLHMCECLTLCLNTIAWFEVMSERWQLQHYSKCKRQQHVNKEVKWHWNQLHRHDCIPHITKWIKTSSTFTWLCFFFFFYISDLCLPQFDCTPGQDTLQTLYSCVFSCEKSLNPWKTAAGRPQWLACNVKRGCISQLLPKAGAGE